VRAAGWEGYRPDQGPTIHPPFSSTSSTSSSSRQAEPSEGPERQKASGERAAGGGGGDGDKLAQDVPGHLHVVLRDHQRLLDVLRGVALTHELLDLAADHGVLPSPRSPAHKRRGGGAGRRGDGAGAALRVDASGQGLGRSLGGPRRVGERCGKAETLVIHLSDALAGLDQCVDEELLLHWEVFYTI